VDVDLFAPNASPTARPAWQVIDAARRQYVTGELLLDTSPPTRVYFRDGQVYFAERTTDGGLGVRLLVEGVITREQMHKGTLHVSGVEHLGRLFERDTTIDRDAVQLCVELMTDDVLTSVADEIVHDVRMVMYKRHASGIDRWLPTRVEVITHVVSAVDYADPDLTVTPGQPPRPTAHLSPGPLDEQPVVATTAPPRRPTVDTTAAAPIVEPTPVATPVAEAVARPAPAVVPLANPVVEPLATPVDTGAAPAPAPTLSSVVPPSATYAFAPMSASDMPTGILPIIDPVLDIDHSAPSGAVPVVHGSHTADSPDQTAAADASAADEINLAPEAMHAIMSTGIADEVAEAVRRALAAIDSSPL
jgi:hypothetical protein